MNIFEFDACLVLESIIQLKKIYFKNVKLASKRIKIVSTLKSALALAQLQ
jgi:hypothetical protein